MRYHFKKPPFYENHYGTTYACDHPVYDRCTLFVIGDRGLAVIQQRFDAETKATKWTEIDPWLVDPIYIHSKFRELFDLRSGSCQAGLYPTMTIRQLMWALRMKPIQKQPWETVFDRRDI